MLRILPFIAFLIVLLVSCKQDDITPSWLKIDEINLTTDEVTQGANSHNITDAWVYVDGKAIGVFELPAKIPILEEGQVDISIFAGIKNNGISGTRIKYPFYKRFDTTLVLYKGQVTSLAPVVAYKSNTKFEMIEDFEDVGIEFIPEAISDTQIVHIDALTYPEIVKWGNNCGGIFLNHTDSVLKVTTSTNLELPKNQDVFMEIDYMNNNYLEMGVIAENSSGTAEHTPLVRMNAQEESEMVWKKIYIDLKEDVSFEVHATSYELYLFTVTQNNITDAKIYIDNIKVVRYQ